MEELNFKHQQLSQALASLKKMLSLRERDRKTLFLPCIDEEDKNEMIKSLRDSLIQRFEYTVDTLWKYTKLYLYKKCGVDHTYPKQVFRGCLGAGLTNEKETSLLIKMVDDRNITSHAYKERVAKNVSLNIKTYYPLMKKLVDKMNPE